jgi:hypothetical protein
MTTTRTYPCTTIRIQNNDLTSALCDLYDIRRTLTPRVKAGPKDNEGTDTTIGECLDAVIEMLEEYTAIGEAA